MTQNVSSNVRKYSTLVFKKALGDEFTVLYANISFDNWTCFLSEQLIQIQIYCNFTKKPEYSLSSLDTWDYSEGNIYTWQQSFHIGSSCSISSDSWLQPGRQLAQDWTSDWTVPVSLNVTYRHCQYDVRALVNQNNSLAWVYLSGSVAVLFACWTGRSLSRMSIENCSLFNWNGLCFRHRTHCVEKKNRWCYEIQTWV